MTDRYYEDFKVGDRFVSGGMTLTESAIIDFARQWDPQPFHIDVEFANVTFVETQVRAGRPPQRHRTSATSRSPPGS